jgi:hypothetical protein
LGWLVRFNIFNYVPANPGSIAYTDFEAEAGVPITQLQLVARMAMTDRLFSEPSPMHIAHTRLSVSLEADSSLQDWIS